MFLVSLVGFLLAVAVAVLTPDLGLARRGGMWFLLLLIFWILVITAPYRVAKRQMKTSVLISAPIQSIFSTQRINHSGTHFSNEVSYEALWAVHETRSLFLLYSNATSAFVLPKRFFKDAAQQNDWRVLVERRITPKVITKSGFLGRCL
jgi:hypothetical protein